MRGLTTYAETVSVYGTEQVFVDGDDTPWSKAFLAACYASRGLKMRFTSGSGAECLMGARRGPLDAVPRVALHRRSRRAAGAQGVQNGGIDGVSVTASVPDGMREVIAENLCVMLRDLESCAGNDTLMSFSDIRRTAHTLPLLLAGADFLFSGFGSIPAYDNAFGPSNFNAEDLDDYLVRAARLGLRGRPAGARRRASCCRSAAAPPRRAAPCYEELGLADVLRRRRRRRACTPTAASTCRRSDPQLAPSARRRDHGARARRSLDVVAALARARLRRSRPSACSACCAPRLDGDYLQTAAIFDTDMRVLSALTDPNDYAGPGTGYRMRAERRAEVGARPAGADARPAGRRPGARGRLPDRARARAGAPASARRRGRDRPVAGVRGHASGGRSAARRSPRRCASCWRASRRRASRAGVVRVARSLDVGNVGWTAAGLSGSLDRDRPAGEGHGGHPPRRPAAAREPRAATRTPRSSTPARYRALGRNAARYARGDAPGAGAAAGVVASRSGRATTRASWRWWPRSGPACGPSIRSRWRSRGPDRRRDPARRGARRRGARHGRDARAPGGRAPRRRGNPQLAENLRRGAELVDLGDDELLSCTTGCGPAARRRPSWRRWPTSSRRATRIAAPRWCARRAPPTCAAVSSRDRRRRGRRQLHHGGRLRPRRARPAAGVPARAAHRRPPARRGRWPARAGVRELVDRGARRLGEPVARLLLAELRPVETSLVERAHDEELDLGRTAVAVPGQRDAVRPRRRRRRAADAWRTLAGPPAGRDDRARRRRRLRGRRGGAARRRARAAGTPRRDRRGRRRGADRQPRRDAGCRSSTRWPARPTCPRARWRRSRWRSRAAR